MTYYDDNFGFHDEQMDDDPEETAHFRRHLERNSEEKKCVMCGRTVMLMPQYDKCDSCATKLENGWAY